MKKTIIVGTLLLAASGIASAATDTSTATVTIQNQAITLTNTGGLNFGTVLPYGRNGSVTVAPNGTHSASNAYVSNDGAGIQASTWDVTGVPGAPYAITLPADNTVTVTNGTETMAVTAFRAATTNNNRMDAAGKDDFRVGATLKVGANQPAGVYTGTFNVTVSYN